MNDRQRKALACLGIAGIFLVIQAGALALVDPLKQEGHQVVENTSDPTISVLYLGAILVVTAVMLVAMRIGGDSILRLVIIFSGGYISFFVFQTVSPGALTVSLATTRVNLLAWGGAIGIVTALYFYPEWYVIDAAGIVMGIGGAGLFGINFGILPALVLLIVLAVYDAISVYGTEHMLTLASGVMEMRVPVVLVVPLTLSYSYLDAEDPVETGDENGTPETETEPEPPSHERLDELGPEGVTEIAEKRLAALDNETLEAVEQPVAEAVRAQMPGRDALYIGLGDAVIPTVLVASAAFFLDSSPTATVFGISANAPAVGAIAGTMAGLGVLLWLVLKGRAHAGLPLLNGGAIAGYLLGALASGVGLLEAVGLSGVF